MLKEKKHEELDVPSQAEPECVCCFHFSLELAGASSDADGDAFTRDRHHRRHHYRGRTTHLR